MTPTMQGQELSKAFLKEEFTPTSQKPFKTISFGEIINFVKLRILLFGPFPIWIQIKNLQ